jgi:hypothetical protein
MSLTAEDRLTILDLHTQYCRRGDAIMEPGGPEAWVALFTPSLRFSAPGFETDSADELLQYVRKNAARDVRRNEKHWMSNIAIEGDGDRARVRANIIVMRPDPDGGPARIVLVGDYDNVVVKVDGEWRFAEVTLPTAGLAMDLVH